MKRAILAGVALTALGAVVLPALLNSAQSTAQQAAGGSELGTPSSGITPPEQQSRPEINPTQDEDTQDSPATSNPRPTATTSPPANKNEVKEDPSVNLDDFARGLIGLEESAALLIIEQAGFESRIVHRDGEDFAVTLDYRYDRLNLHINSGIVTRATLG